MTETIERRYAMFPLVDWLTVTLADIGPAEESRDRLPSYRGAAFAFSISAPCRKSMTLCTAPTLSMLSSIAV